MQDVLDERAVAFESRACLRREGSVLAGLGAAGELVEAAADTGEFEEQGLGRRVGPGSGCRAERGLADEASWREA